MREPKFGSGGLGDVLSGRALAVVFALAFAARLLNLGLIGDLAAYAVFDDAPLYWNGALWWLESGSFTAKSGTVYAPEVERVPGYFLFLVPFRWLFGDSILAALVGQATLDALTCVVIAVTGSMVAPAVGLVSGLLAALWPNLIIHSAMILSDSVFVFLFSIVLLFSARYLRAGRTVDAGAAGLACGVAIMTRTVAMFLPFAMAIVAPIVAWRHRRGPGAAVAACLLVVALAAVPAAPLVLRNLEQFGTAQLTTQKGTHALYWVVGQILAQAEQRPFEEVTRELLRDFTASLERRNVDLSKLNPYEQSDEKLRYAAERLSDIPLSDTIKAWLSGAVINLASPAVVVDTRVRALNRRSFAETTGDGLVDRLATFLFDNDSDYTLIVGIGSVASAIALALQFLGWTWLARHLPYAAAISAAVILYILLINGPVASPKYRLPIEPVLIILQAAAMVNLYHRFRARRRPR